MSRSGARAPEPATPEPFSPTTSAGWGRIGRTLGNGLRVLKRPFTSTSKPPSPISAHSSRTGHDDGFKSYEDSAFAANYSPESATPLAVLSGRRQLNTSMTSLASSDSTTLAMWLAARRQTSAEDQEYGRMMSIEDYERKGSWLDLSASGSEEGEWVCPVPGCDIHARHMALHGGIVTTLDFSKTTETFMLSRARSSQPSPPKNSSLPHFKGIERLRSASEAEEGGKGKHYARRMVLFGCKTYRNAVRESQITYPIYIYHTCKAYISAFFDSVHLAWTLHPTTCTLVQTRLCIGTHTIDDLICSKATNVQSDRTKDEHDFTKKEIGSTRVKATGGAAGGSFRLQGSCSHPFFPVNISFIYHHLLQSHSHKCSHPVSIHFHGIRWMPIATHPAVNLILSRLVSTHPPPFTKSSLLHIALLYLYPQAILQPRGEYQAFPMRGLRPRKRVEAVASVPPARLRHWNTNRMDTGLGQLECE